MVELDLRELGLTQNETKAYHALVRFGKSTAARISKESTVPYSKIYAVLSSLETKGLAKVIPDKTKFYIPTDPENILLLIEEKKKSLEKMKSKVDELKKLYDIEEEEPVIMATGKKNFYQIVWQMKDASDYSYSIKHHVEVRPEWIRHRKQQLAEGVVYKDLVRYDEETKRNVRRWLEVSPEIKQMENEGVAIGINDDKEVLLGLIRSNTTLLIRDVAFAKMMRKLFESYYAQASKV